MYKSPDPCLLVEGPTFYNCTSYSPSLNLRVHYCCEESHNTELGWVKANM